MSRSGLFSELLHNYHIIHAEGSIKRIAFKVHCKSIRTRLGLPTQTIMGFTVCYVMLRYVMLFYVMLCYVML